MNDFSSRRMPASSGHRSRRSNASTAFLGIGQSTCVQRRAQLGGLAGLVDASELQVRINGVHLCQTVDFSPTWCETPRTLLADVSEFMTLREGDVLMLGCNCLAWWQATFGEGGRHASRSAHRQCLRFAPTLTQPAGEGGGHMKHARVAYAGAIHDAIEARRPTRIAGICTQRPPSGVPGRRHLVAPAANPAATAPAHHSGTGPELRRPCKRAREFKAPEEPLALHQGRSRADGAPRPDTLRPPGVTYMHYECELTIVIGRTATHVSGTR